MGLVEKRVLVKGDACQLDVAATIPDVAVRNRASHSMLNTASLISRCRVLMAGGSTFGSSDLGSC